MVTTTLSEHTAKFVDILQAVLDVKTTLETKRDFVPVGLELLQADHKKLAVRVTENGPELTIIHPTVPDMQAQLQRLREEVEYLKIKAENAEGGSQKNNMSIVGCLNVWRTQHGSRKGT
ncbi:hypothetical protein NDU88_001868 [Pleurodeles waltl]|uniref:Uncharacterized protein n=1 Tax=Pleurodeles waltl TaxID=8319 RepID=A0AAV7KRD1_PLEWA|nr:hypothetical protein NDU88_001868 [Pleurodeles waltl]